MSSLSGSCTSTPCTLLSLLRRSTSFMTSSSPMPSSLPPSTTSVHLMPASVAALSFILTYVDESERAPCWMMARWGAKRGNLACVAAIRLAMSVRIDLQRAHRRVSARRAGQEKGTRAVSGVDLRSHGVAVNDLSAACGSLRGLVHRCLLGGGSRELSGEGCRDGPGTRVVGERVRLAERGRGELGRRGPAGLAEGARKGSGEGSSGRAEHQRALRRTFGARAANAGCVPSGFAALNFGRTWRSLRSSEIKIEAGSTVRKLNAFAVGTQGQKKCRSTSWSVLRSASTLDHGSCSGASFAPDTRPRSTSS